MGVDAVMFVKTRSPVKPTQVLDWAYELASAFGASHFQIDPPFGDEPASHCLRLIERYRGDFSLDPDPGEQLIEVTVRSRHYGPGHERGNLPLLVSMVEWWERRIPDSQVLYGDEHGREFGPFGKAERERLFDHFCRVGHFPLHGMPAVNVLCATCQRPMFLIGGAVPNIGIYSCPGCDREERVPLESRTRKFKAP